MAGTQEGGRQAAATNKQRYGLDFYRLIGSKGGKISRGGGFAMNRDLAVEAGRKGGKASRRTKMDKPVTLREAAFDAPGIPVPLVISQGDFLLVYRCPACPLRFSTKPVYQKHYSAVHAEAF